MGTLNTANINLTGNFNGNQPGFRVTLDTTRALQGQEHIYGIPLVDLMVIFLQL